MDYESIGNDEVLDYLSDNLVAIGIDSKKTSVLSAYLLAAYSMNIPLILAGYGAIALADIFSSTLFNCTADRMYVDGKIPPCATGTGKIVAVHDAFGCMDKVQEATKGKYVYFIAQISEELAIEPRSIFNYALPVFLEYFTKEDADSDAVLGCILDSELKSEKEVDGKTKIFLPAHCLPKLAFRRLEK